MLSSRSFLFSSSPPWAWNIPDWVHRILTRVFLSLEPQISNSVAPPEYKYLPGYELEDVDSIVPCLGRPTSRAAHAHL